MKIGADAMLLGTMVKVENASTILDIGTGTGVLALMIAQQMNHAHPNHSFKIDALEIDMDAAKQAADNIASSPWPERIKVIHDSLENYSANTNGKYDLIVSNPPYFEDRIPGKGGVVPAMKEERKKARLSDSLSISDLMKGVCKLLNQDGKFQMIFPAPEAQKVITISEKNELFLAEIINIKSFEHSEVIRNIFTFTKVQSEGFCTPREINFIIYESPRKYSREYLELTREFHGKELK